MLPQRNFPLKREKLYGTDTESFRELIAFAATRRGAKFCLPLSRCNNGSKRPKLNTSSQGHLSKTQNQLSPSSSISSAPQGSYLFLRNPVMLNGKGMIRKDTEVVIGRHGQGNSEGVRYYMSRRGLGRDSWRRFSAYL